MTPRHLIMLAFFLQPVAFGSWLPRIPDIQQRLGMGPAALSIALLGLPVGIGVILPFAGPLVARIGARKAIQYGFIAYPIAVCLPVLAFHPIFLFAALMIVGISISALELGLNVAADEIERSTGKAVMSTCHGCWSLGIMAGNLVGAGLAALHVGPQESVALVAALVLLAALPLGRALPGTPATAKAAGEAAASAFFIPGLVLYGICVFAFGTTMAEGAAGDWSAIYLRQIFGADPASAGLGYAVFAGLVALGRFLGDGLKVRFGPAAVARATALTALAGFLILFFSPSYAVSMVGFALGGFGVSMSFPLAVSAAAGLGDRPAAQNVAVLSLLGLSGFLFGPPVIGFVAQHAGMRWGLLVLVPGLAMSAILAGLLRRGAAAPAVQPAEALPIGNGK